MKIFFEDRERQESTQVIRNGSYIYPAHFHLDMEIFIQRKGEFGLSVGDESYTVGENTVVVMDSYEVHSYDFAGREKHGKDDCVLIIPYKYLAAFNRHRQNMKIVNPVLCDKTLCDQLLDIVDAYLVPTNVAETVRESATKLFLAVLSEKLSYEQGKLGVEVVLIRKILAYIQENYRQDISLESTAKHLGYSAAHVSRAFHKYIKSSLPDYVNRLRLDYIERALANGENRKKTDLVYEAGFKSQQTYYRVKSKHGKSIVSHETV